MTQREPAEWAQCGWWRSFAGPKTGSFTYHCSGGNLRSQAQKTPKNSSNLNNPQSTSDVFSYHRRLTSQLCKFPFRQINEKKNMETEITIGPKGVPALLYLIFWHIGSFAPTETLLLGLMALQNFLGTVISLFIWKTIRWLYVHIIYSFDTLESLFIYFSSGYLQVSWSMPREIWCNPPTRMPSFGNVFAML